MVNKIENFDWNQGKSNNGLNKTIKIVEETLRDGLQGGAVKNKPNLDQMQNFLHHASDLGVDEVNIGFPASSEMPIEIAKYISSNLNNLSMFCTARSLIKDVIPILNLRDKVGADVYAALFVGTSPIRTMVEDWDLTALVKRSQEAVEFATRNQLDVMFVTEDTTRTPPNILTTMYKMAIDAGASIICLADTVGQATPDGVKNLVSHIKTSVIGDSQVQIEWHGHNDRGFATANAIQATVSGVDRVATTALGIGERAGNVPTHEFAYNLYLQGLLGCTNLDLAHLIPYSRSASQICKVEISSNEPIIGSDIFITESGIHAAAIAKAETPYDANNVYSSVDAQLFGRKQDIVVGPSSGKANVLAVLQESGVTNNISQEKINSVLLLAKNLNRQLTIQEILEQLAL